MRSKERRDKILEVLKSNSKPIRGIDLAKMFNVSRQVIVQDIAILRAKGKEIMATPYGYILSNKEENFKIRKKIVCKHTEYKAIEEELKIIIDMGGKVLDVIVEHPIYGEIKSPLMISSRIEIEEFMNKLQSKKAEPLSSLTDGIHIHTIEVPSEDIYQKIKEKLNNIGYLINI